MSGVTITITGLDKLVEKYGKAKCDAALKHALEDSAQYTAGLVKEKLSQHTVTGFLRSSITGEATTTKAGKVFAKQGSGPFYAKFVEQGTGIYGPSKHVVVPTSKKVMAWHPKTATGKPVKGKGAGDSRIVRRATSGQKPVLMFHNTYIHDQGKIKAKFQTSFMQKLTGGL